ncbi:hypothetical protein RF679_05580 [Undibacterium cyanobacteriorum]|uniref:Porin n=1 Tax=Undibacterium cyanobacteriorum TaxID=3073561 RepID=A0ABY9RM41_9BURK|nr:hypothetical protein [Undibacterium sp. 20NA77.5]WMW81750.1 hypothetical protein RF679_05580 [Undibacterium sp. 20NA77.5]
MDRNLRLRLVPTTIAAMLALAFSMPAHADKADKAKIAELEKKLEKSLALIEQLNNRLAQVETNASANAKAVATTSQAQTQIQEAVKSSAEVNQVQLARLDQIEKNIVSVAETSVKKRELGLPLHGFADAGYVHTSKDIDGRKSGFALGNLDFYMTPEFGDRIKSLFELTFEFNEKGEGVATDLERLQLGYTFSDSLTLWAGRVHTPYGYWNTAYHHGAQLQPSIMRPKMIAFEDQGGILPAHTVGVMASGSTKMNGGRLEYDAIIGNGSRIVGEAGDMSLDFNAGKDDNSNKALGGNLRYRFGGDLDGLTVGVHTLNQEVQQEASGDRTKFNMYGGFLAIDSDNWEAIGEYYRFNNKNLTGKTGSHTSWAAFGHVGYRLSDEIMPYVRYEKAALDQTDNYFAALVSGRSYNRQVLGLRYNLSPVSAVKFEFGQTAEQRVGGEFKYNESRAQFSVRF